MSEVKYVYVVAKGERAEGHDPERVFWTLDGAREWTQRNLGVTPAAIGAGTWMATDNGVDEVWIYRMKAWDR